MTWTPQPTAEGAGPPGEPPHGRRMGDKGGRPRPAADRRPLVLIATGQLQVRALGTTVLQAAGFEVWTESRGEAIVGALEAWPPDLILAEMKLVDMDAARLCSLVRETAVGRTIPILVVSDFLHSPTVQEILSMDFTDLVSVPVNWKVLTFRINRWISMARKFRALDDQELDFEQVRDSARKASTELLQLRNYDSVTGLPNREMFLSTVGLVVAQNERSSGYAAVLFVDIDDFKGVNDLIGRALGDELLRIVAKRLQGCLREGDIVSQAGEEGSLASFARLTGDQFAILLSSVQDQPAATAVAERLLASLSRPLTISDRQFRLTAKIGIADASQLDGEGEEVILQRAETAMRYCKQRKGRSWAFFESFMNELVLRKLELKAELQQALEQDQLFFCYQLLVDSRSGDPQGVEALVRWQHPLRGLIPPNEFLPVAEESDLILEIDRWVLRNGCLQGKKWRDEGLPPLLMSLNLSMRFLEEKDFAEQVLAIVEETGLPPASLQIELSERGTLPEAGRIMPQFEVLVRSGVHLALDDFGTGQTSLSYLRTLPITCVKVDRSFVRRVPGDSASVAIVTAISAMSHHLGLKVVAEGVETEEHWRFLAENGYDQLQGFLFSRAEPVEEIERRLRSLPPTAEPRPPARRALPAEAFDFELELGDWEPRAERLRPGREAIAVAVDPNAGLSPEPAVVTGGGGERAARLGRQLLPEEPSEDRLRAAREEPSGDRLRAPREEPSGNRLQAPLEEPPWERLQASLEDPSLDRLQASLEEPPGDRLESSLRGTAGRAGDGWSQSEDYLLELARRDFLTKLHNRFSFDERLEHAVAHADRFRHKVALLLIDLDDFKYVNDTHGHAIGDELLITIAKRLKSLVRKVDTLARIGGDEFAVVLSECHDVRQVADFAGRMLAMLAQPVDVEGRELRVTGSMGIAIYPAADTEAKDLLRQADLALYKVKNSGGNKAGFFAQEMDHEVQRDLALARDLGGAVERGELFLEYQMQVELETGSIVGAEALVRWDHPVKGVIAPGRFIPIAENTGEIRNIGRWVIQSACAEAKLWRSGSGRDVRVSVNLSPVQCRDSRFVAMVLGALREHELAAELLDLEVNERLLKHLPKDLENSLRLLAELGVGLTLDNFGTGSSALEYFQRYRFNRLKIHQSLVRTISGPTADTSVLSGVVALARNMNVQIVAEGIEKPVELERLRAEGCDQGQGFLFSRPLSAEAFSRVVRQAGPAPGFSPEAGAERRRGSDPALDADVDEILRLPATLGDIELGFGDGEILAWDAAELPDAGREARPSSDGGLAGDGQEDVAAPEEPPPVIAAPAADSVASELRRLSSFVQPAAAARSRRRRRRIGAVVATAALGICGLYLLRGGLPWSADPSSEPRSATSSASGSPSPATPSPELSASGTASSGTASSGLASSGLASSGTAASEAPSFATPAAWPPAAEAAAEPTIPATSPPADAVERSQQAPDDPTQEILDFAERWTRAWSEQRIGDYLGCYAEGFRPADGMSRRRWEAVRRERILAPGRIEVRLSAIEVAPLSGGLFRVSFDQSYRSDSYSDLVRKTWALVREDGDWRILEETVSGP